MNGHEEAEKITKDIRRFPAVNRSLNTLLPGARLATHPHRRTVVSEERQWTLSRNCAVDTCACQREAAPQSAVRPIDKKTGEAKVLQAFVPAK